MCVAFAGCGRRNGDSNVNLPAQGNSDASVAILLRADTFIARAGSYLDSAENLTRAAVRSSLLAQSRQEQIESYLHKVVEGALIFKGGIAEYDSFDTSSKSDILRAVDSLLAVIEDVQEHGLIDIQNDNLRLNLSVLLSALRSGVSYLRGQIRLAPKGSLTSQASASDIIAFTSEAAAEAVKIRNEEREIEGKKNLTQGF